jgi:tRNA1Val (adenine37-N6)-methyltransferase
MPNQYFQFKKFTVQQEKAAMKVCTDACLFGAWIGSLIERHFFAPSNILDIGTGTGLLSLMLAQKSEAKIEAIEIDEPAAAQAVENFEASPWNERLTLIRGDIKTAALNNQYDLVISNPPFFEDDLKSADNHRNLALHSEELTLKQLIGKAIELMSPGAVFAVLLPFHRKSLCKELASKAGLFVTQETDVKQTEKHSYFRSMLCFALTESIPEKSTVTIKQDGQYSTRFTYLLKDYYLYL